VPTGRLVGTTIMAIGCGTPDGEVNNGFAAATAFLREGAKVCLVDRDPRALDEATGPSPRRLPRPARTFVTAGRATSAGSISTLN
jgi:NAD(P)-dependent dehydrogenase (short-subunit alcohol dehydrogenase family)